MLAFRLVGGGHDCKGELNQPKQTLRQKAGSRTSEINV